MLGISLNTLYYRIKRDSNYLPSPIGRENKERLYDEDAIKAMANWQEDKKCPEFVPVETDEISFKDIHRGMIMTRQQRNAVKLKRLASKTRKPCSQKVILDYPN